jgi:hypothetical protein
MADNPLKSLYRKKSVYVALPSQGKHYNGNISLSVDGELGVMPMTASDEILLKTPDALFNGDAVIGLLRSCAPDIADPAEMPSCDLDVILLAIRMATGGDKLEVGSKCPSCGTEDTYDVSLGAMISTAKPIPTDNCVVIDADTRVYVRPYSLRSQMKGQVQKFHNYRMQMALNEDLPEEQKAKIFNEALLVASGISVQLVADNITKVMTVNPETREEISVTDRSHIFDWVENMDSATYEKIIDRIRELSDPQLNTAVHLKCGNCQHEYDTSVELNPMTFFI